MKKHFILFVCCLALMLSGMTQPETGKFVEKIKQEKLGKKINLEKENLVASQKQMLLSKMQTPTKSLKSEDWWEPDTIYQNFDDMYDVRRVFSYEKGNCTADLWQARTDNQWEPVRRFAYTYDLQNNMIEELTQSWEETQWLNGSRFLYKYDTQNNLIEELIQYFEDNDEWEDSMKIIYSYDSQNKMTEALLQVYEEYWEDIAKVILTYDVPNNTITRIYYWWEWDDELWEAEEKVVFTYDAQNNLILEVWYGWNDEWYPFEQLTYSYDKNNNATEGFYQYGKSNFWMDEIFGLIVYYNNMQSQINTFACSRFTATYIKPSEIGIKENDLLTNSVKLYPNPVSNILHIETNLAEIPEVKIYSIQGVLLMHVKGNQIDVSSLPNGIYIAEVNGISRKVVKQ